MEVFLVELARRDLEQTVFTYSVVADPHTLTFA